MVHRISLLLLGDSRDRVLYGQTVGILCTGERGGCQGQSRANGSHTTAKHCYSWQWAAPARFPIHSNWQSAGGALCTRASSHLAAFGYMRAVSPYPQFEQLTDHANGMAWYRRMEATLN